MIKFVFLAVILALVFAVYHFRYSEIKSSVEQLGTVESAVELKKILDKVETTVIQTVKLYPSPIKVKSIEQSKFGGKPYWPNEMEYPQAKTGKDLFLLAQINFSELPARGEFPTSGILQFFIAADDLYGLEFPSENRSMESIIKDHNNYRVVYHKEILSDQTLLRHDFTLPGTDDYLPLTSEYSLTYKIDSERVPPYDYHFEKIVGDISHLANESWDQLYEELDSSGSKIGGYAFFTQSDPRQHDTSEDWLLLFQMDTSSTEGVDIMWGDSGVGNFFIRPQDLEELNFDRVWYNWDCY